MNNITCDQCGKDLTTVRSGYREYRYDLVPVLIPSTSPTSFAVMQDPPPKGNFCSLACLGQWIKDKEL